MKGAPARNCACERITSIKVVTVQVWVFGEAEQVLEEGAAEAIGGAT